jgi:hypothetical protein
MSDYYIEENLAYDLRAVVEDIREARDLQRAEHLEAQVVECDGCGKEAVIYHDTEIPEGWLLIQGRGPEGIRAIYCDECTKGWGDDDIDLGPCCD